MKVRELIKILESKDQEADVVIAIEDGTSDISAEGVRSDDFGSEVDPISVVVIYPDDMDSIDEAKDFGDTIGKILGPEWKEL